MTRLPNFLIIGAMRAGTTTLFQDLETHPDIFMPENKEPAFLCHTRTDRPTVLGRYGRLFQNAAPHQLCAEASTAYTKLPDWPGVPAYAKDICGPDLKMVYIVREPIARARSAHHHDISKRDVALPIDRAMREVPRFLDYSRYAMQLDAWLESFPPEQIYVLRFEDYVADRESWARRVCAFLGIDPAALPKPSDEVFNQTANRPTSTKFWRRYVHGQDWYELYVKPKLPRAVRQRAAELVLPKAPAAAEPLAPETVRWMIGEIADDTARFEKLFQEIWPANYTADKVYDLEARYRPAAA
jgi:hypothetical protein